MKVIGYIRVSTDNQDLTRQKELIAKYCKDNGHRLIRTIGEKLSGAKSNREGLHELLSISKQEADVIAISELSRFSREDDIMNVISQLNSIRSNGVDLYILDSATWIKADEVLDAIEVMKLVFTAKGNADERRKIATRMTTGRYTKLLENPYAYIGGQVPYGFTVVDNPNYELHKSAKTLLKIDEQQANYLRIMYSKIVNEGFTLPTLARYCIENKIEFAKESTSKDNYVSLLYKMLTNPIYKGERMYKGETFSIEPIIDADTWNRVKDALKDNKTYSSDSKKYDKYNPLKGILKCSCGHNLYVTQCKDYFYYKCGHKKTIEGNVVCKNNGLKMDMAFKAIWENSKYLTLKESWDLQTTKQEQALKQDIDVIISAYDALKLDMEQVEKDKANIVRKIEQMESVELISIFNKKYQDLEVKGKKITDDLTTKEKELKRLQKKLAELEATTKELKLDSLEIETKSAILHNIIEKATWYSRKLRSGFLVIDYKNGLQIISMVSTSKKHNLIWQLPSGFMWDEERECVKQIFYKKNDEATPFKMDTYYKYYTYDDLRYTDEFPDKEEWVITEEIDHSLVLEQEQEDNFDPTPC